MYRLIFVLAIAFFMVEAKHLPSYIKPCKKDDPNFKACVKQHAIDALPYVLKGDKEYKNPNLLPLHIPQIALNPGNSLSIKLNDVVLRGFETVDIEDIVFDLEKQHVYVKLAYKWMIIEGQYDIDGKILVLPIKGNGPANITCENLVVEYSFDYKLETHEDGKQYFDPNITPVVTYTVGKTRFHFGNLFNGDKKLGETVNQFMNEHEADIYKEFSSAVSETIKAISTTIVKGNMGSVPYEEIFL